MRDVKKRLFKNKKFEGCQDWDQLRLGKDFQDWNFNDSLIDHCNIRLFFAFWILTTISVQSCNINIMIIFKTFLATTFLVYWMFVHNKLCNAWSTPVGSGNQYDFCRWRSVNCIERDQIQRVYQTFCFKFLIWKHNEIVRNKQF